MAATYPFPGLVLPGRPQFEDYKRSHSMVIDHRFATEQAFANDVDIIVNGICPLRGAATRFLTPLTQVASNSDGVKTPDWRNGQVCEWGVPMADRSCAHYALYENRSSGLGKVLVCSHSRSLETVLHSHADSVEFGRFEDLDANSTLYDTILVVNALSHNDDIRMALTQLHSRLKNGGKLYININFHYNADESVRHSLDGEPYWAIGWDLLPNLDQVGFKAPVAITYWAQELGYFGPHNFIFEAHK